MVQFQYIDFRLLYVVVLATMHGLISGLIAAGLACVSLIINYSQLNVDWQMLLYNAENWIPFACYLIVASIAGYTKERYTNDLKFLKNENEALEERFSFQNELYREVLKNKGEYKAQILSYSGSFGRIYEVARRLNSLLPEVIFKEALESLEDLLINQTICIYTVTADARYARLAVCSQKLSIKVDKSLKLDNYTE
jgi:K+-sensing histidine kinase KdpD